MQTTNASNFENILLKMYIIGNIIITPKIVKNSHYIFIFHIH